MRVTFVDNLLYEDLYTVPKYDLQPHLGLLSLVAVARASGHEAQIYDPKLDLVRGGMRLEASLYEDFAGRILDHQPDAVGFTALGCNFNCVAKVAAHIKRSRPALPVLLGGPHATILHREILERFSSFDLIARNEAERTLPALLERLPAWEFGDLAGVSYRTRRGEVVCNPGSPIIEDLDELPLPAYDSYPLGELALRTIRVEAGRGCPFSCTFCSTASFFGRSYRLKSTPRLLAEMDHLHATYGYADFKLNHDLFTVNRKKVVEFCQAMLDRNYTWGCSARVDCVDQELLDLMWRAGCRGIYFGIESGSRRMQAISRKRLDLDLVEPIVDVTTRLGMTTITSFITGYPEEDAEDQVATLDLVGHLFCRADGLTVSQLHLLTPEPGTQLMSDYGDRLLFDGHVTDFNFPQLEPDDCDILKKDPVIFGNHHYFPSMLPRERHVFITSAWNSLRLTGRVTLAYALRAFDGRLSRFLDEARHWYASRQRSTWAISAEDLNGFIEFRFGPRHHLVSLFRYALAVRRLREAGGLARAAKRPFQPPYRSVSLALGANTALLHGVHDCMEILERIGESEPKGIFEDASMGPIGDLLLVSGESSGSEDPKRHDNVATYLLDRATADLLERFTQAKSYWQCCREIMAEGGEIFPEWADVEALCQMGVLTPQVVVTETYATAAE
jgi:radical SAM superfamily enzyme YgiQ (UPF0313 family)